MSPRRMEEASVAGESPDRSKQQKSSGTARGESDPRLSVFREPSAGAEAGGGTDTATAVFRTGPVPSSDGESVKADSATAVFRTRPSENGEGGEDAEDGRGPEQPEASGAAEGSSGAEGAEDAKGAGEAAEGPEGASESSDESSEAAEPSRNVESAGSAESADVAESSEGADVEHVTEPADAAAPEEGDTRLRAAVTAWVTKGDDQSDEGPKGDDDAKVATSEDETAPDADADADADTDAVAEGDASEPVAPAGGASGKATASNAAEADASAGGADEPSDDASEDAEDSEDAAASEADAANTADADSKAGKAGKPGKPDTAEDKRGIDQPTAVFRAPAAAEVDQPTTALKIIPPTSKPDSGAESKPESAAERTSKFVPLRGDDIRPAPAPAPRKPEAPVAASASTPGPPPAAASLSGAERTTQQPMPPKPPLDLLAELTNTPPPPQTPVRTAVRRVKIWTPLVLLLLIIFAVAQMVRPLPEPALQMSAKPTYTFKGSKPSLPWPGEGQGYMAATGLGTVDSFGEQKPVPIGSVAKAMTAYIVLKDHPLKRGEKGPSIKIDAKAESDGKLDSEGESTLNTVKAGDKLTEEEALSAIMIPSANNIARLLARWDAGSEKAFVEKMNDTAKSLGMTNTTYTDPSGLNATTVSSAEDQVKLGQKLVEIPALMDITKRPSWTDPSGKNWRNYNTLVPYNGALGIKTGSTTKAGGNLLFAAHKMVGDTDQLIVGAVLGQHKPAIIDTVNAVSKEAMVATQDLLTSAKVVKKGDVVGTVSDGLGGSTPVVATKDVSAVGWPGLTVRIELTDDGKTIPHSAAAGTHVGTLTVGEGTSQVKVAVALQSDLAEPTFGSKLTRIS
ncbi:D-alanyl-D-alanine carboxypeptidase [Streptomyces sp. Ncost-T10-10d]|uniref:D-alanyl-D-alanine carboxypeptidase n=1 Tax=Streptomyces sp. Ncost-T10-10d TaxID=1839774 RepID=UPI00081D71D3|nr:D-alanyl-D-alanine carboxypeptidase [Streptomyces sp. Ncost-T10-10d]SCF58848.1 D-alanyl-D-alanine carboxypeptidase [Streptomyces sp. Ncost-T10-10d]